MLKLTWSLMVAAALLALPALAQAADANKDVAKKDVAKKDEKKPEVAKEEPKKPTGKETSKFEFTELEKKNGSLKKQVYQAGQNVKKPDPDKVEFTSETQAIRVTWKTDGLEDKKGAMAMTLVKKRESPNGKNVSWQNAGRVGVAKAGTEGSQIVPLAPGTYRLEITGEDIKYDIVIEAVVKATASK